MPRRKPINETPIRRIEGILVHDAWASYTCLKCDAKNYVHIGRKLLSSTDAYENALWTCENCGYIHSRNSDLPEQDLSGKDLSFKSWGKQVTLNNTNSAQGFWRAFFKIATEYPSAYWKQCNACGRILPYSAFSKHKGWGPLEKQMECRSCKSAINALLNPKRTAQQLHESSVRRRIGDLLLAEENRPINQKHLFKRFNSRCFKTGKLLDINDRSSWAIDHLLPSRYLYPLRPDNAVLLSREANENKRDRLPSDFFSNEELIELAKITGANLELISQPKPVANPNIDVDKSVERMLNTRSATDLPKRIVELKKLLKDNNLVDQLSSDNKRLLGFS